MLLADIIPSFGTKLIAPYFIHVVPYSMRVIIFVFLSIVGMFVVAMSPPYTDGGTIASKISGIILASFSAGAGELSFVGLTHFYGPFSLAAWGSGTGAAGLVGAGAYSLATTAMGISVKATLLASALLPFVMAASFFLLLPRDALKPATAASAVYHVVERGVHPNDEEADEDNHDPRQGDEEDRLLGVSTPSDTHKAVPVSKGAAKWGHFRANLRRLRKLFFP